VLLVRKTMLGWAEVSWAVGVLANPAKRVGWSAVGWGAM